MTATTNQVAPAVREHPGAGHQEEALMTDTTVPADRPPVRRPEFSVATYFDIDDQVQVDRVGPMAVLSLGRTNLTISGRPGDLENLLVEALRQLTEGS